MSVDAVDVRLDSGWPSHQQIAADLPGGSGQTTSDHFVVRDGCEFAGSHLIIDFWSAEFLDDLDVMERAFRETILTCGATLLHLHLHHFTPNDGISGVAVLAESHISVHTWPERGFAAFDVFMCGEARPELAPDVLASYFHPDKVVVNQLRRGLVGAEAKA
jgi:S-adenosylmethionine decarboxylase